MEFWNGPDQVTLKIIKDELKEDENRMKNNLKLLEEWIDFQMHLPKNYDKRMLPIYLRGCKHDLEKAKRKVELYFIAKHRTPELFANHEITSDSYENVKKSLDVAILPKLTPEGYRVTIYKITNAGPEIFDIPSIIKRNFHLHEIQNAEEYPNAGYIFIIDDANFTAGHLGKLLSPMLKRATNIGQEALPFRVKQIHIINANGFVIKGVTAIKSFMKEKIRNRFHIHKDIKQLLDFIPPKVLPLDYGGIEKSMEELVKDTEAIIASKLSYLQEQESVKCHGYIPDKYQNVFSQESYGVEGSFRKLNLD